MPWPHDIPSGPREFIDGLGQYTYGRSMPHGSTCFVCTGETVSGRILCRKHLNEWDTCKAKGNRNLMAWVVQHPEFVWCRVIPCPGCDQTFELGDDYLCEKCRLASVAK